MTAALETALSPAAEKVRERDHGVARSRGAPRWPTATCRRSRSSPKDWPALARFLRDDPAAGTTCSSTSAASTTCGARARTSRFEAVVHLYSLSRNEHVRRARRPRRREPVAAVGLRHLARPRTGSSARPSISTASSSRATPTSTACSATTAFVGHPLRKDYAPGQRWFFAEDDLRMPEWSRRPTSAPATSRRRRSQLGPSHPATHGIIRLVARLDGETIVARGDDDRLPAPVLREDGRDAPLEPDHPVHGPAQLLLARSSTASATCATVEKMLGVEVPDRGRLARTILSEFSRIMDHCVCIGANLVDIGALTNFSYLYQTREEIYDLLEACCGARLTVSYVRIGGPRRRRPGRLRGALPPLLETIPTLHRRRREAGDQQPDHLQPPFAGRAS